MKKSLRAFFWFTMFLIIVSLSVLPAGSQDKPSDGMQHLMVKIKADKKAAVNANMDLTDSEAKYLRRMET